MKPIVLGLHQVGISLPQVARPILTKITYNIYQADFIILLGHNGSGKSSLLKVLDGRYQATSGAIAMATAKLKIHTLTQDYHEALFGSLTILENCLLAAQPGPINNQSDFFAAYLADFNQDLAQKLDAKVVNLSGGQQQALALAISMLRRPDILLLDEHTSALDPKAAMRLMAITAQAAQKYGITCVLSTHDLNLALTYGNRILALAGGAIAQQIELEQKQQLQLSDLLKMCY